MFGPSQSPEPYNKFPYNDYPYDDINYPYKIWEIYRRHHPSVESLRQSAATGCLICGMLYERWTSYSESSGKFSLTSRTPYPKGVSFYFFKWLDGISLVVGDSEHVNLKDPSECEDSSESLLALNMAHCKLVSSFLAIFPFYPC